MNHSQLHAIDLAIIGAYLIAMIVIGLVVVKKIKNTDDYYLGALIAFTMMGTVAAQVTATATIINMLGGEIGVSYEMGALIACAAALVIVSLATYKKSPSPFLDPYAAKT